jgi:hypothetical protein
VWLVVLVALAGCKSLADRKEGPSPKEIEAARNRIDRVRDLVIESQFASDDDEEKEFWLSVLRSLGDFRDKIAKGDQR